jgi:hypothetical protein
MTWRWWADDMAGQSPTSKRSAQSEGVLRRGRDRRVVEDHQRRDDVHPALENAPIASWRHCHRTEQSDIIWLSTGEMTAQPVQPATDLQVTDSG